LRRLRPVFEACATRLASAGLYSDGSIAAPSNETRSSFQRATSIS
jgi:hypothetical protein